MDKRIGRGSAATFAIALACGATLAAGSATATPSGPAVATGGVGVQSVVCTLTADTVLRPDYPGGSLDGITVHAGRGFRVYPETLIGYHTKPEWQGTFWVYGHSAEAPNTNGWILSSRITC
jgi:hypothetical protein